MFGFEISLWLILGFFGQSLFFMRFIVQWVASERKGESTFPVAFWYFSIAGGTIIFIYALHIKDPVFAIGQSIALLIYTRNLILIRKKNAVQPSIQAFD